MPFQLASDDLPVSCPGSQTTAAPFVGRPHRDTTVENGLVGRVERSRQPTRCWWCRGRGYGDQDAWSGLYDACEVCEGVGFLDEFGGPAHPPDRPTNNA